MPLYTLACPKCEQSSEHLMGSNDVSLEIKCPVCAEPLSRERNRAWWSENIGIAGDTCAGSCNFSNYWDEGMDTYVHSRDHRKEEMKKRGVVEFARDPAFQKYADERRYIRKNSPKGDKEAVAAQRKLSAAEDRKRKETKVDAYIGKLRKSLER